MLKKTWMLSSVLILATTTWAGQGGESGGGGNAKKSTIEEVSQYVSGSLEWDTLQVLTALNTSMAEGAPLPVKDAKARNIISKILALPQLTWNPILDPAGKIPYLYLSPSFNESLKIGFLNSGACLDGSSEKDASARLENVSSTSTAEICMSGERLARFPQDELKSQLPALMLHELAHLAGFGEEDAGYIQDYYLNRFSKTCSITIYPKEGDGHPVIYINVNSDLHVAFATSIEVKYSQFITPQPQVSHAFGNNRMDVITHNSDQDFSLNWTPEHGSLKFALMNGDGSYTNESLSWGPSVSNVRSDEILSSNMQIHGKGFNPGNVYVWDCAVR
ncbi:MAG: hypothetical protein ACJ763_09705 [Bdellovibrionia bacterium]